MKLDDDFIKAVSFWDKIDGWIVSVISAATAFSAILGAFITWRYDRKRLAHNEEEIERMKIELEKTKLHTETAIENIEARLRESENRIVNKIDKLTFYLLHSKITYKGEEEKYSS